MGQRWAAAVHIPPTSAMLCRDGLQCPCLAGAPPNLPLPPAVMLPAATVSARASSSSGCCHRRCSSACRKKGKRNPSNTPWNTQPEKRMATDDLTASSAAPAMKE